MMDLRNLNKTVWVDLLCWRSALEVLVLRGRSSVEKVYYANTTVFFRPWIGLLEKVIKRPVRQILDIVQSEERIEGVSLYERIHRQLADILETWLRKEHMVVEIKDFCQRNAFNIEKYAAHLKESAFPYLYRPVELMNYAEKKCGIDRSVYLLRKTPFRDLVTEILGKERVVFYGNLIPPRWFIRERPDYGFDEMIVNNKYYTSRFDFIFDVLNLWISASIFGVIFSPWRQKRGLGDHAASIGIELNQHRTRLDEVNDIGWLQDPEFKKYKVFGFEMQNFDAESSRVIASMGIEMIKEVDSPRKIINFLRKKKFPGGSRRLVVADAAYGLRSLPAVLNLWFSLLFWNERGWLRFQKVRYMTRTLFWTSIYRSLGIKVLWSMYDVDADKLVKAQAIECAGGLYAGGHWSNNPIYVVYAQKSFDVLLTWGPHFITNNFGHYPSLAIFPVGYLSDHYFEKRRTRALRLRDRYEGKFILSYQDNAMAHDYACSKGMQVKMHKMIIDILKEYPQVVAFLKPKRSYLFDAISQELPELREFQDQGRLLTFFGETPVTKAIPAEIGMASDLVIGLGVSTPASECFFAGTVAFHADLTGFTNNKFAQDGLGQVVFGDVESLQKAVEDRITGRNDLTHAAYHKYYEALDPFQDGQAFRRVGFLIGKIQAGLVQGLSREEAIAQASKDYDVFLQAKGYSVHGAEIKKQDNVLLY